MVTAAALVSWVSAIVAVAANATAIGMGSALVMVAATGKVPDAVVVVAVPDLSAVVAVVL